MTSATGKDRAGRVATPSQRAHNRRDGFTLIELLVVISLVVTLMGILAVYGAKLNARGYIARTEALIERLGLVMEDYKSQANGYPADGLDAPLETSAGTPLESGTALGYALTRPVQKRSVSPSGELEDAGMGDPVGEFTESEKRVSDDDPEVVEILDAWGNALRYDNLQKGKSAYSVQDMEYVTDPREDPEVVPTVGPQNSKGFDIWSHGPKGDSKDSDPKDVIGNWIRPSDE